MKNTIETESRSSKVSARVFIQLRTSHLKKKSKGESELGGEQHGLSDAHRDTNYQEGL